MVNQGGTYDENTTSLILCEYL